MNKCAVVLWASLVCAFGADYKVVTRIPVGGEGGWDYLTVDSPARRLYVSHATHVVVVNLDTNKVAGDIPDTPGVHGIAIAPKLGRGFVSNGRGNNITIFDLGTLKTISQVPAGQNPDSIVFDPASNRVFAFNGRSKDASVIDAAKGEPQATIPLGGKPEFSVVDGQGKLWVNIEDTHEMVEIDTAKATVTRRFVLEGCEDPSGLAFDPARKHLFSVCGNKVMAISDAAAGKLLTTVPIGANSDGVAFDPGAKLALSSNGDGTITVVGESAGKYKVVSTIQTGPGARTIAVDSKTHKLYLPTAKFGPLPEGARRPPVLPGTFEILVVGQ